MLRVSAPVSTAMAVTMTMTMIIGATKAAAANSPTRSDIKVIDPHAIYPEGPVWKDGTLFYVEYGGPGVKAWDGHATRIYWKGAGCGPSGLIPYAHGHWLIACYDANALVELDEHAKAIRTIDKDGAGNPFIGPNDFAADRTGGMYFSASGVYDLKAPITGKVLYLAANGQVAEVANTIHYPNGLTVSKDGKTLLVAEALAGRILAFPIGADGTLGVRSVWARLQDLAPPTPHEDGYNGPDGFKLGPDGNYYIAQNGSGRILVVSDQKTLVRMIRVPTAYVTNMNFGDGDAKTIYITGVFDPWKAPYPGMVYRWTR